MRSSSGLKPAQIAELDKLGFEWNPPTGMASTNRASRAKEDKLRRKRNHQQDTIKARKKTNREV